MTVGVVFDLEGTLVKLPIDYEMLYREIERELKIRKAKPLTQTLKELDDESRQKAYKLWEHAELEALANIRLSDEGIELYKNYSKKPLALVTMQGRVVVRKILDRFHLSFAVIVTREDEIDRVWQIKRAIAQMGLKPRDVLFIGDRDNDEAAAKQIGCGFVRVIT